MSEHDRLAERFEVDRSRLRAVAYRMLGSSAEADDAVQETWIRASGADTGAVENMSAWLTTIVARISLNMLKSRTSRREDFLDAPDTGKAHGSAPTADPEQEALLADSVGVALLVVLDTLTPAERLAFVLHDMFAVPFEDIAPIVDRSAAAARQLASRARRRVQQAGSAAQGAAGPPGTPDEARTRGAQADKADLIRAFLAASREGEFEDLLAILDPDIVVRADPATVRAAQNGGVHVDAEIRGADAVTRAFLHRVWSPVTALIDGSPGLAWVLDGQPRAVFRFSTGSGDGGGRITAIDIESELAGIDIVMS